MISKLTLLFLFIIICDANAQENTSLKTYTPPPMFGDPKPVPPKKAAPDVPTMPKLSLPAKAESEIKEELVEPKIIKSVPEEKIEPSKTAVIPLKKPEHPKVKFEGKPIAAIPEEETIEKNKTKDVINKKVSTPASAGVVKGPKTMPSNKKENVETEILFKSEKQSPSNLMDRLQETEEKAAAPQKNNEPAPINPSTGYTLPNLDVMADGSQKLNLIFQKSQATLAPEQINTLNILIIPALKKGKNTRLLLEAFASPQNKSLNGDRRLALTRAMAIRTHITEQGISPNRLDVRSLGAQTNVQPMDRVEILLIN